MKSLLNIISYIKEENFSFSKYWELIICINYINLILGDFSDEGGRSKGWRGSRDHSWNRNLSTGI